MSKKKRWAPPEYLILLCILMKPFKVCCTQTLVAAVNVTENTNCALLTFTCSGLTLMTQDDSITVELPACYKAFPQIRRYSADSMATKATAAAYGCTHIVAKEFVSPLKWHRSESLHLQHVDDERNGSDVLSNDIHCRVHVDFQNLKK